MTGLPIPYLAGVDWYRSWFRSTLGLEQAPVRVSSLNRGVIRGAWGEQTLTVPIEGGRRRMARTPYGHLRLSEHDDWRHKHWQAITSAYGAFPYYPYFKDELAPVFTAACTLHALNQGLHSAFLRCSGLDALAAWIRQHGRPADSRASCTTVPGHVSALELLFMYGPETVFYLI